MRKVLITGARGFIGWHALRPLSDRGFELHGVSTQPCVSADAADVCWHQADLLDAPQVERLISEVRPTHMLHFAWVTSPPAYWTSQQNLQWVRASLDLVQQFTSHGGRRAVVAGTCAEYDWRFARCSESLTPTAPNTLYGSCKHALHTILDALAASADLSVSWGRIFYPYGPREHPRRLVPSVIRAILTGQSAQCSHGNQIRDFLYVQDAADAFAALLDSDVTGPVNIASGVPVTLKTMILRLAELLDGERLVELGAIAQGTNDPDVLVADVGRLRNEVGWSPSYDLDTGLQNTIAWWRTQQR